MKIGFAQINTTVGDIPGNCERILRAYHALEREGADIILTPELAITGYPPQDLLFKSRFVPENLLALERLFLVFVVFYLLLIRLGLKLIFEYLRKVLLQRH